MSGFYERSPVSWSRRRLRFLMDGCQNGAWGSEAGEDAADVICVRVADFEWEKRSISLEKPTLRSYPKSQINKLALRNGDLLIEKSGGGEKTPVGRVVEYCHDNLAVTSNFVARIRPISGVSNTFFLYLLVAQYISGYSHQFIKQNTGIQNLDDSAWFANDVWLPDLATQEAIAKFLDRDTARIDQLIEKKRRLVEVLGERLCAEREASVWFNSKLAKLGHHVNILPGYAFPSKEFSYDPDDVRLLRGANVGVDSLRWDDVVYWPEIDSERLKRFRLEIDDLVMGMDRPWISAGMRVATVGPDDVPSLLLQRVCKIKPRATINAVFLKELLRSRRFLAHFEPILTGVSVPHISPDQIGSFRFPYVEPDAQASHMERFARLADRVTRATHTTQTSIDRLREFRSALITAAVTARIDVSTWGKQGTADRRLDEIEEATGA